MASIHKNAIRMDVLHTYRVTEFSFFSSDTKQKIEHRYRSIRHSILMLIYFPAELVFSNVSYSLLSVVGYYWLKHHTCVCFNAQTIEWKKWKYRIRSFRMAITVVYFTIQFGIISNDCLSIFAHIYCVCRCWCSLYSSSIVCTKSSFLTILHHQQLARSILWNNTGKLRQTSAIRDEIRTMPNTKKWQKIKKMNIYE